MVRSQSVADHHAPAPFPDADCADRGGLLPTTPAHRTRPALGSASSGRSRTGFACSAARRISSAMSPPNATTACWAPRNGWRARATAAAGRVTPSSGCVSTAPGNCCRSCDRDGVRESYLAPHDHRIGVVLSGNVPANVSCAWNFDDGEGTPQQATVPCDEEVRLRVVYGRSTMATVDIVLPDGTAQRVVTEILVRDVLIAGHGRFCRCRRRQSRSGGALVGRRLLLPAFSWRREQRILPARARRLYRQQVLHRGVRRGCAREQRVGPPERALGERRLPSFALRLPDAHGACAGGRKPAPGGDLPAAGLLGRHDRGWFPRLAEASRNAQAPAPTQRAPAACAARSASSPNSWRAPGASARTARSTSFCSRSVPTTSCSRAWSATSSSNRRRNALLFSSHMATVANSQNILDNSLPGEFVKLRAALKPLGRRQHGARGVRFLRQSGAGRPRHALPRRPRRLRRASGIWCRRGPGA